jgi:hypothetical protein
MTRDLTFSIIIVSILYMSYNITMSTKINNIIMLYIVAMNDYFLFGLVFIKKYNKISFFSKKLNWFKLTSFSYFRTKISCFWFGLVFPVCLCFFSLTWFFFRLARFFSVWVRFGFFSFKLIKPNRSVLLKIIIIFFSWIRFLWFFF